MKLREVFCTTVSFLCFDSGVSCSYHPALRNSANVDKTARRACAAFVVFSRTYVTVNGLEQYW